MGTDRDGNGDFVGEAPQGDALLSHLATYRAFSGMLISALR